ncbi:hypothetical protein D9M68_973910 [compost metagenome]
MSQASRVTPAVSTKARIRTSSTAGEPPALTGTIVALALQVCLSALAPQHCDAPHSPLGLLDRKSQG